MAGEVAPAGTSTPTFTGAIPTMIRTLRFACLGLALLGASAIGWAADASFPAATWGEPLTVEASGWSREGLQAADKIASSLGTQAYLVVHRGALVHGYGDIAQPLNIYSVRKSLLDVLFGVYVDRGVIDLAKSLEELGIDDEGGLSQAERKATVRQLLQARSGVYHEAAYETREAKAERPARGSHAPGEHWYYNNWDFNTLGGIFERRTGKTVFEALRDDLAGPLQFEDFRYPEHTENAFERSSRYPAYVMKLSARDLARVGLLMARDGRWRDRQIVPASWVAESTDGLQHGAGRLAGLRLSLVGTAASLALLEPLARQPVLCLGQRWAVHRRRPSAGPRDRSSDRPVAAVDPQRHAGRTQRSARADPPGGAGAIGQR
jgi:CubicO group peptidase (beta-lactamase class C family)